MKIRRGFRVLLIGVFLQVPAFYGDVGILPEGVASRVKSLGNKYEISDRINPYYLRGDFDGDGRVDYAVLLTERGTKKRGMVIVLSSQPKPRVIGAGTPVQYGSAKWDDLNFDSWRVYGRGSIDAGTGFEGPPGNVELILVEKKETASGFFRWSGTKFTWVQQGD